jgi:biopolymer transport protein ExbB
MKELIARGGYFMVPVVACSAVALAIFVERLIRIMASLRHVQHFVAEAEPILDEGSLSELRDVADRHVGPLSATCYIGLTVPMSLAVEAMRSEAAYQVGRLGSRLRGLSTIAHIAPLLGLLGTVSGMISAFREIEIAAARGAEATHGVLAGGIWEALLTTAAGLVVAIPAFAGNAFLASQIDRVAETMERFCGKLAAKRQSRALSQHLRSTKRADTKARAV